MTTSFDLNDRALEKPIFNYIHSIIVIVFYFYFLFPYLNREDVILISSPRIIRSYLSTFNKARNKKILHKLYSEPIHFSSKLAQNELEHILFNLILNEKNKWLYKNNDEIIELLAVSLNSYEDCKNLYDSYYQEYNQDLIIELRDLCSSYNGMSLVLNSFIQYDFIEANYPYNIN